MSERFKLCRYLINIRGDVDYYSYQSLLALQTSHREEQTIGKISAALSSLVLYNSNTDNDKIWGKNGKQEKIVMIPRDGNFLQYLMLHFQH